jgi:hypothetical protein
MGGTHGVGEEADVGGAGQKTCVAVVTYVVWQRAVPLSGGCFGARRLLTGSQRARVALSTFNDTARLLEAAVRAHGSRRAGPAWCAPNAAPLASVW